MTDRENIGEYIKTGICMEDNTHISIEMPSVAGKGGGISGMTGSDRKRTWHDMTDDDSSRVKETTEGKGEQMSRGHGNRDLGTPLGSIHYTVWDLQMPDPVCPFPERVQGCVWSRLSGTSFSQP